MQAIAERSSASPKVLVFRTRMGAQAQPPPQEQPPAHNQTGWWQRHGNTAQWAAAIIAVIALLGLFANIGLTLWFHYTAAQSRTSDDHVNALIDAKLTPAINGVNENIDSKLVPINQQLKDLTEKVGKLEGRFDQLDAGQKRIAARIEQQASLAKLIDPNRVLATIRAELKMAENSGKILPASDLADYKNAIRALPPSAYEYWRTAAAIVNYQSKINQMSGEAPDPVKVSRPCAGLTAGMGGSNVFVGKIFSNCIVDLDTNDVFQNVMFRDSVIRYKGGPTNLANVMFVNCNFQLDLPPNATPAKPNFLFALLDSPNQTSVKVQ